jgi:hypothetical protein
VGNHTNNLEQYYSYNDSVPTALRYINTKQPLPTGEYSGVAMRPFDQNVLGTIDELRMSGWSNFNGISLEAERRYSHGYGFQLSYTLGNAFEAGGHQWNSPYFMRDISYYPAGSVPADYNARDRFLMYQRNVDIPKHRVKWNWLVDLPFGKGKMLAGNANKVLDKFIGGWQLAGIGSLRSTWFTLPTSLYPTGAGTQIYGYQYPIQDCRSGSCLPGYLYWNGYIPANQINSVDANGKPNGIMGVPSNYKPAAQPLWPWPATPNKSDPMYAYYGTNTVWLPLANGSVQRVTYADNLPPLRNQFAPGVRQWNVDASLFKAIPFKERYMVRFNADFFNVFNHPGNPNSIGSNGVLSTVSSGQAPRVLQLTLRLSW